MHVTKAARLAVLFAATGVTVVACGGGGSDVDEAEAASSTWQQSLRDQIRSEESIPPLSSDDCNELAAINITTAEDYLMFFQAFSPDDLGKVSLTELGEVLGAPAEFAEFAEIAPPDADTEEVFAIVWDEITAACTWAQ